MLNKNKCNSKKIFYLILFILFIIIYSVLELINLYVQYRTFIYLNQPNLRKTYLWLVNLLTVHFIIKFLFACLKLRDYYNKCKRKNKIN